MSSTQPSRDAEQLLIDAYNLREESPEDLFSLVYEELRQVARAYMRRERADHTLQATALVNEAYLRLFGGEPFHWENRKHLFCTMARTMWRVLINYGETRRAWRHGGAHLKVTLDDRCLVLGQDLPQFLALDQALERLARLNPRHAEIVELHSFVGLTEKETAEVLGVSVETVKRDWRFAKAWLKTEMGGGDDSGAIRPNRRDLSPGD